MFLLISSANETAIAHFAYWLQFLDWIGLEGMFLVLWSRTELSSSQTDLELLAVLSDLSVTSLVGCQGEKSEQERQVKEL